MPDAVRPAFDAREPAAGEGLGPLPEWDLTDLYAAPDAPELARDLAWLGPNAPPSPPTTRASSASSTPRACSAPSPATRRSSASRAG